MDTQVLSFFGGATEQEVVEFFEGLTLEEIQAEMDKMWPHENHTELAQTIHEALNP